MDHPLVIEIKGPAGAGKTTVMEALADYLFDVSPDSNICLQEEGAQTEYVSGPQLTDPARRISKPMRIDIRTQMATRAALGLHGENRTYKPQPPKTEDPDEPEFGEGDYFRFVDTGEGDGILVVKAVNPLSQIVVYAHGDGYRTARFEDIRLVARPKKGG